MVFCEARWSSAASDHKGKAQPKRCPLMSGEKSSSGGEDKTLRLSKWEKSHENRAKWKSLLEGETTTWMLLMEKLPKFCS